MSDTSVIELVADLRAATPTQAVMRLVPAADELRAQLDHLAHRLLFLTRREVERRRQPLDLAAGFELFRDPARLVGRAREVLDRRGHELVRAITTCADRRDAVRAMRQRLARATAVGVARLRERTEALGRQLAGLDPHGVLARGYSYTMTADGRLVASVRDVKTGEAIVTRVPDGSIESIVGKPPGPGQSPGQTPDKTRSRPRRDGSMDLFERAR